MKTVDVSSLVLDFDLYPRHSLDAANVASLVRAIEAGATLPAVVVDETSRRVVDGFHRIRATQRVHGPTGTIAVRWQRFATDADLFVAAVELNAVHGVRLTRYDEARCLLIADRLHVDPDTIAGALHVTVDAAAKLRAAKTAIAANGKSIPIRRTSRHLAGRRLTAQQEQAERRTGGGSLRFYVDQVRNAVAGDLVDWDDEPTVAALAALDELLHPIMARQGPARPGMATLGAARRGNPRQGDHE